MKRLVFLFVFFVLTFAVHTSVDAQANQDVCALYTHQRSFKESRGGGNYFIGKFTVDDIDAITTKKFRHETDGRAFSIEVEIEYGDYRAVEKKKPIWISFSLTVKLENKEPARYNGETVTSHTKYRHKWGYLQLEKELVLGDDIHNFSLLCGDGVSNDSIKRRDPLPRSNSKIKTSETSRDVADVF